MNEPIKAAVIYGSTRPGRFCDTVVKWTVSRASAAGRFLVDIIDPAHPLGDAPDRSTPFSIQQRLAEADAFIVVTPEYNHGYPAPLKALIDSSGREWHAKPVAFVSYGGVSGGLRAVEQLRLVFAELHAVTVRDSVSFAAAWEQFDAQGGLLNPERPQRSMDAMLNRLAWWAVALRNARLTEPFLNTA